MTKRPDPVREEMRKHGFYVAAEDREMRYSLDTVKTWENYPKCMEIYPKQLRYIRDETGAKLSESKHWKH